MDNMIYGTVNPNDIAIDENLSLFITLAKKRNLHNIIQSEYIRQEWDYYEAYLKSEYKEHPQLKIFSIHTEKVLEMIIGIFEFGKKQNDMSTLLRIIKKGYNNLYRYMQENKEFDTNKYLLYIQRKKKTDANFYIEFANSLSVAVYLGKAWKKKVAIPYEFVNVMLDSINPVQGYENKKKKLSNYKNRISQLKEKYKLTFIKDKQSLNSMLFNGDIQEDLLELHQNGAVRNPSPSQIFEVCHTFFGNVLETSNIDPVELQEMEFLTREDIDLAILDVLLIVEENSFFYQYEPFMLAVFLYKSALAKLLQETKNIALHENLQIRYKEHLIREKELNKKEKEIETYERKVEKKLENIQKEVDNWKNRYEKSESHIRELERNNKRLNNEVEKVTRLKERITELELKLEEAKSGEKKEETDILSLFEDKKITIFGGHPNWVNSMKDVLPSARYVDVDDINKDISFIESDDIIYVNTDHFNHSFFNKIQMAIKKYNTKIGYISNVSNSERSLIQMSQFL